MNIGTNAGHTLKGPGSGAVGVLNESKETRAVVKELNALLKLGGHTVINCNIDSASSQNAYLEKVVQYANREDLDYFISVHFNKTKGAKGVEAYTYKGKQFPDALEVCKNISALGFVNRGVRDGTGLYVIRKTKAKAILIEVCFVDEPDASKYKKVGAKKITEAIYKAIVDTNLPKPSKPATSNKDIEVDGIWGPATTRLAQKVFGTSVDGIVSNQPKTYASKNTGLLSSTFKWENPCTGNSPVIKAIQKWCGAEQDGRIGPSTIKKMQKKLGTPIDGRFDKGGQGIKAFQRWLNKQ